MATVTKYPNPIVGNYESQEMTIVITSPAAATSEAITIPEMSAIDHVKSFIAYDSGNNVDVDGADITVSGNTVTIADGTSFDYSAMSKMVLTVLGKRKV